MDEYAAYTDMRALSDFRNRWDERARQAEIYLSFRLEGLPSTEANELASATWQNERNQNV